MEKGWAIEPLKKVLSAFAELHIEDKDREVCVPPAADDGFEVTFWEDDYEATVCYGGWHAHCEPEQLPLAVRLFLEGLTDATCLEVVDRGGFGYRWSRLYGTESPAGTITALVPVPFWRKKRVRYLQNHHLQAADIESVQLPEPAEHSAGDRLASWAADRGSCVGCALLIFLILMGSGLLAHWVYTLL